MKTRIRMLVVLMLVASAVFAQPYKFPRFVFMPQTQAQINAMPKEAGLMVFNSTEGEWQICLDGANMVPLLSAGGAPTTATYIVQTSDATLSGEQVLGSLATGLLKNTTTTGVLSIAAQGTDYWAPGGTDVALADGGTGASTAIAALDNLSVKSSDIASATTTDLSTATGDFVDITGTTTITGFGTMTAGRQRVLRFTGALTLTHNATSLIIPGGANITTAANDRAVVRSLGAGNWIVIAYVRASGVPTSGTNSGDQTISLTGPVTGSGTGSFATTISNNVVTGAHIALGSDAQGDIMYYNGTDWVRLGAGTSGQFLQTQGVGANLIWATASGSGDVSSNTATSVDNEFAVFNGTSGKSIKRATGTGLAVATSGVFSAVSTSAGVRGFLSDETGTGSSVFSTAPVFDGKFSFSGTTHFGINLNKLTDAQRDGNTGVEADFFWNSTRKVPSWHDGAGYNEMVLTTGAANGVAFFTSASAITTDATNFFWNTTTNTNYLRLGAGTSPGEQRFREGSAAGEDEVIVRAPASLATSPVQTWPNSTGTIVNDAASQTLTNKTLTRPIINGGSGTISAALATDDTYDGVAISGLNAGATVAQWEAVYMDVTTGEWLLADANGTGTYPVRGIAVAAGTDGNPLSVLVHGTVRNDAWAWTVGGTIYLSATAGALTQTAPSTSGDKIQQVGFALTADIVYFTINSEFLTVQ